MKLLIVTKLELYRFGLIQALQKSGICGAFIAEAESGEKALKLCAQGNYDAVIIHDDLPKISGLETIKKLVKRIPHLKIIFISKDYVVPNLLPMYAAGAKACLTLNDDFEKITSVLKQILEGKIYLDQTATKQVFERFAKVGANLSNNPFSMLSKNEFQTLILICEGKNSREIAETLFRSYGTVLGYKTSIKKKIRVKTTAELIAFAVENGLLKTRTIPSDKLT